MGSKITGKIERHERGYGFLLPDDQSLEDIFIPPGQLGGAMSGDRVEVKTRSGRGDKSDVGTVMKILSRGVTNVIGTIKISSDKTIVIPDSIRLDQPIRVPDQSRSTRVKDGELVEVEIETYEPLQGVIVDVLGDPGDPEVEDRVILKKYELDREFTEGMKQEAKSLPDTVPEEQLEGRKDLRHLTVITIDPKDAKDLDDAISIKVTRTGNFRVGVHITDVSHYIQEGSLLDEEARERATSTYLVDRVIPMFPKEFSNGIGSLDQEVDRLSVTVFLTVDPSGSVIDREFHESVINVDQRLSYEEVDAYVDDEDYPERLDEISDELDMMIDVSQKMRARRTDRGSLDFDLPEVRFELKEGEIKEVIPVEYTLSHQAIEEFMIAANEAVADYLTKRKIPMLYRIHETPEKEDVESFAQFIQGLGYELKLNEKIHPQPFQRIMEKAKGKPEQKILAWNLLRTMKKARYSTDNQGHFGLASQCYCHFTSPIRRYPDLTVHRVLKQVLGDEPIDQGKKNQLNEQLPELATHTSERERAATDAERESVDVKLLQYMEDKVGEEREGYITSVLEFGCFVQLPNTAEGLIHVSTLDDYYVFNEDDYTLIGERSGQILHIGDKVRVKIARVDIPSRELDFTLLDVLESRIGDLNG